MEKGDTTHQNTTAIYSHGQYASTALNVTRKRGKFPNMKITEKQVNDLVASLDRWSAILGAAACGLVIGYIIIPAIGRIWGVW